MKDEATYLGNVRRVVGATVYATLSSDLPSTSPIVNGRVYRVGQIGSFVRIPLGFLNVYGIVSMVGAAEVRGDATLGSLSTSAECTLEIKLIGEAYRGSAFQRGLSIYPTVDDEVHVVTEDDLAKIYAPSGSSSVCIGSHSASESLAATLELDKLVTRHGAILGSTGSGKSNTVAAILKAITNGDLPKAQVIVIDPHGEYGAAFQGKSRVFSIGSKSYPFTLPYWCLSFDELGWFLVDRRSASESVQDGALRDKVFEMRQQAATQAKVGKSQTALSVDEITADSPLPFDVRKLWYHFDRLERVTFGDMGRTLEELIAEGDPATLSSARFKPPGAGSTPPHKPQPPPVMASYTNKILQRLKDRRYDFLLNPGDYDGLKKDLGQLVDSWINHDQPITVFDLAGVPPEVIDLVVGLLSRVLFEVMFWGRDIPDLGKQRPVLLVFEEAHRYLPSGEGFFIQGYARRSVQRILKEGRKYGLGALLVSQRPSELDETILSQCGTFVALRLTNGQDQGRVKSAVPDELAGLVELLPALRTGEAIITGEAMQIPSRVRIQLIEPRPNSGDPEITKLWSDKAAKSPDFVSAVTNWRRQRST
ncbi:DNA helicase HerA-like ATPase [Bradyrhizobium sp. USDA 3240]